MTGRGPFSADYPFEPNFIEINGAAMHYADVGEGKPFLLLHGNFTWSYMWRNVIPHLEGRGHSCVFKSLLSTFYHFYAPKKNNSTILSTKTSLLN